MIDEEELIKFIKEILHDSQSKEAKKNAKGSKDGGSFGMVRNKLSARVNLCHKILTKIYLLSDRNVYDNWKIEKADKNEIFSGFGSTFKSR